MEAYAFGAHGAGCVLVLMYVHSFMKKTLLVATDVRASLGIIHMMLSQGRISNALELFEEMKAATPPTHENYNQILRVTAFIANFHEKSLNCAMNAGPGAQRCRSEHSKVYT